MNTVTLLCSFTLVVEYDFFLVVAPVQAGGFALLQKFSSSDNIEYALGPLGPWGRLVSAAERSRAAV